MCILLRVLEDAAAQFPLSAADDLLLQRHQIRILSRRGAIEYWIAVEVFRFGYPERGPVADLYKAGYDWEDISVNIVFSGGMIPAGLCGILERNSTEDVLMKTS